MACPLLCLLLLAPQALAWPAPHPPHGAYNERYHEHYNRHDHINLHHSLKDVQTATSQLLHDVTHHVTHSVGSIVKHGLEGITKPLTKVVAPVLYGLGNMFRPPPPPHPPFGLPPRPVEYPTVLQPPAPPVFPEAPVRHTPRPTTSSPGTPIVIPEGHAPCIWPDPNCPEQGAPGPEEGAPGPEEGASGPEEGASDPEQGATDSKNSSTPETSSPPPPSSSGVPGVEGEEESSDPDIVFQTSSGNKPKLISSNEENESTSSIDIRFSNV